MATVATETDPLTLDMAVTLPGIGWDGFEAIARMKGDRSRPRLLYRQGSLTLVSPSQLHEQDEDRLDSVVKAVCCELAIPCTPTGATLFRRRDLDRGIEGDRTYYLANEPVARRDREIDLNVDPPPDLAIEVEVTHPAAEAVEIWRRLGVPEVWAHQARQPVLKILHLDDQGRYVESPTSRALPFLTAAEILRWVARPRDEPESYWEIRLRRWVRDELAPRVHGGA